MRMKRYYTYKDTVKGEFIEVENHVDTKENTTYICFLQRKEPF